jgi:hypothetical protein
MATNKTVCTVTRDEFNTNAKALEVVIDGGRQIAMAREFSTGSLGWGVSTKITLMVNGKAVVCQVVLALLRSGLSLRAVGRKLGRSMGSVQYHQKRGLGIPRNASVKGRSVATEIEHERAERRARMPRSQHNPYRTDGRGFVRSRAGAEQSRRDKAERHLDALLSGGGPVDWPAVLQQQLLCE